MLAGGGEDGAVAGEGLLHLDVAIVVVGRQELLHPLEAERRERRLLRVLRRRRRSWPFAPARHTYMGARVSEMRRRRETDTNVGALSDGDDTRRAILDEEDSDEDAVVPELRMGAPPHHLATARNFSSKKE